MFSQPSPVKEDFDVVVGINTYSENPPADSVYKIKQIIFTSNEKLELKKEMRGTNMHFFCFLTKIIINILLFIYIYTRSI